MPGNCPPGMASGRKCPLGRFVAPGARSAFQVLRVAKVSAAKADCPFWMSAFKADCLPPAADFFIFLLLLRTRGEVGFIFGTHGGVWTMEETNAAFKENIGVITQMFKN